MKQPILLAMLMLVCAGLGANSILSLYGFPEQYYSYDVYSMGAGDTGRGDLFRDNLGHGNPALAVTTNDVNFTGATTFGYMDYSDKSGETFRDDGITFPFFGFVMPLHNLRVGLHFASMASGNVENTHTRSFVVDADTVAVSEVNRIQSNIYRADLLLALKNDLCDVGVAISGYNGQRVHNVKQDYDSDDYVDTQYERTHFFQGIGASFGLARKFGNVSVGATYCTGSDLSGDSQFVSIFDTYNLPDSSFSVPASFSGGVTWRMKETLKVSCDAHYELWGDSDFYTDPQNTWKLGLGLCYDPIWGYGHWYERIPLRCGVGYRLLPFKVGGEDVKETTLSFGASAPLKDADSQIHFALRYVVRGDKDKNGLEDRCVLFSLGFTGFDIFQARKRLTAPREIPMPDSGK